MLEAGKQAGAPSAGDWVSGKSLNDERFRGFVRLYDPLAGMVAVTVVESDHTEAVGRTVFARESQVKALPTETLSHPEALRSLIDLALEVRDEAWFYELTAELLSLEARQGALTAPA